MLRHTIFAGLAASLLATVPAHAMADGAAPCVSTRFTADAIPGAVLDAPFLVFGEVHGTREVPAFVVDYLCAAARAGRAITMAIEFASEEQGRIDAFMESLGAPGDVELLTSGAYWRRPMQDGRTSAAMLGMFQDIRALRAAGADIALVAIDGNVPQRQRDSVIAARLRTELDRGAQRQVLALIGGPHAIHTKGKRSDPQYESAIHLLAARRPLALTVGTDGGTAWVCQRPTPAACGATAWDVNRISLAPPGPFSLAPPSQEFDGVFHVGATTASPPALTPDIRAATTAH